MSKGRKILLGTIGSLAGLLIILVLSALIVLQSTWFSNFARQKIIAGIEDSTGGRAEIGSLQVDVSSLTIRIRDFVLHGTEPNGSNPLLRVDLLELRIKLLSRFASAIDLSYLGIDRPSVHVMVLPDGTMNIPQPKSPAKSSQTSGLETVVNLAVKRFEISNGLAAVLDQKANFSGRGENLRVLLNYDTSHPRYAGNMAVRPLLFTFGNRPPLQMSVNLPVALEKDAIRLENGTILTDRSRVAVDASLVNLKTPQVRANLSASLFLPEIVRSVPLGVSMIPASAPQTLTAQLVASMDEKSNRISLQAAEINLGRTKLHAAGSVNPGTGESIQFTGDLALNELSRLAAISGASLEGTLQARGRVQLDKQQNYSVDAVVDSDNLGLQSGTTHLSNIALFSPIHVDPYLLSMDGLRVRALGGSLGAKLFLERMRDVSIEGNLRSFSIPVLVAVLSKESIGYDGVVDGTFAARGNIASKGTAGYSARANFIVRPGLRGIPVSGRFNGFYQGSRSEVQIVDSYLELPNSRFSISGSLNREVDLAIVSHNLNDFLPAINFGSTNQMTSLPVTLQGGSAQITARVMGSLAEPRLEAHLEVIDFAVEQRSFRNAALDFSASASSAAVKNGLLAGNGLTTSFDGQIGLKKWKPLPDSSVSANVVLRNGDLGAIAALAGEEILKASGMVTADIHIRGTYGNPLGNATLQISNGNVSGQTFSSLASDINLADQVVKLSRLEVNTAGGSLTANGVFRHPRESMTKGHLETQVKINGIQLAQIQAIAQQRAGVAGTVQLTASASGDLSSEKQQIEFILSNVTADLSGSGLMVQNQSAGGLRASARTEGGQINYSISSDFAGSSIAVRGRTALAKEYATYADASIKGLSLAKALKLTGQGSVPVSGDFSADIHVAGTLSRPNADLDFLLADANVYQEPLNRMQGSIRYSDTQASIPSIRVSAPAGTINLSGTYDHPAGNFAGGSLRLKLQSSDIQLAEVRHLEQMQPRISGRLHLDTDLAAQLVIQNNSREVLVSDLNADLSASGLRANDSALGGLTLSARTSGSNLSFRLDSNLAQTKITGSGQAQLSGDYRTRGDFEFNNVKYSNIAPFLPGHDPSTPPALEGLLEGGVTFSGPLLNTDALTAQLQLRRLDLRTNTQSSPTGAPAHRTFNIQNQDTILVSLNNSLITLQNFRLKGPDTSVTASGSVNLKNQTEPLALNLAANLNLTLLQDISRDFYSSGAVSMDTMIRGSFAEPRAIGQVLLKNANINYSGSPNGISNANGVIQLNGTNASIQTLTGESGGGKVSVTGFIGFAGVPSFNLRATASKVRVRYTGVSASSDASIELTGNLRRSLLDGTVTVHRIAYASSSDAGSILSSTAAPPSTSTSPSPLLTGMRLAIRVVTAPDLQVVSTYSNRLSVLANLSVRGTAATPGIIGRITVTDGQLVFFGNSYTVNTGSINFYNPNAITPVVNVSLETVAQGVDVTIGVTGPMDNLKLTYRSDPPLSFEQIVQLLATNTTPANPVIAAHQPAPAQQSLSQLGESAILGQAVANPLASRVQRVFGLSAFKIDPSFTGNNGSPDARVTLQEKIASNITFTYITDVTQTNGEIVRVQWDLTNNLSAVGLRDFNGNVSVEVFYKFTKR